MRSTKTCFKLQNTLTVLSWIESSVNVNIHRIMSYHIHIWVEQYNQTTFCDYIFFIYDFVHKVIAIPIYAMCSKWASRSKSKVAPLSEDNQDKAEELRAKKNDNYMNMSLKAVSYNCLQNKLLKCLRLRLYC